MTEHDIAYKYVHGLHDALTDSQEKTDMANDIINFAKEYHAKQLRIYGVVGRSEKVQAYVKWKESTDIDLGAYTEKEQLGLYFASL